MFQFAAIALYFTAIFAIGALSYSRKLNSSDFILGNRSLNYWVTALAAHASDMSSWLFMAFPGMIFAFGLSKIWIAVGLTLCMYFNWHLVASKIRVASEQSNSLTFFSYIGNRFGDQTGAWRITAAVICTAFYTVYISVGLMGLGVVIESLFQIPYTWAIFISILITLPYVLIGGYKTLAWIDLFQGLFLMAIIVFVPCFLLGKVGGWEGIQQSALAKGIPHFSFHSLFDAILVMLGWGLGYFGQPTIITKFMGIKHPSEISKSKNIGMSWMFISLSAAILVGLVGIPFFKEGLANPEMVFIELVKQSFHPFLIGLILCAVFAASINVMSSQILVLCSTFTEDVYKSVVNKKASSQELLRVSRMGVIAVSAIAFVIAYFKLSSIYTLVLFAWSGLGAAFGPLLIFSLYSKRTNMAIAWVAILSGGLSSALWPWVNKSLAIAVDPIIVGFLCSFLGIWITCTLTQDKSVILTHRSS